MDWHSYRISDLKESETFIRDIRWDLTPKKFMAAGSSLQKVGQNVSEIVGVSYMLYVDLMRNKPTLMIMKSRGARSKTVGYVEDIPEDMLKEAMGCEAGECIAGMYPLTERLEAWLKKELGINNIDG